MDRLTETSFDKEMRIGFSKIDRIFDDAILKLDAMKAEYEKKLPPTEGKIRLDIFAMRDQLMNVLNDPSLFMGDMAFNALQKMPMSFDRGQNDMSVAARIAMGGIGFAPVYRSPLIGSGIA